MYSEEALLMMMMKTTENDGLVTDKQKNLLSWTNRAGLDRRGRRPSPVGAGDTPGRRWHLGGGLGTL